MQEKGFQLKANHFPPRRLWVNERVNEPAEQETSKNPKKSNTYHEEIPHLKNIKKRWYFTAQHNSERLPSIQRKAARIMVCYEFCTKSLQIRIKD